MHRENFWPVRPSPSTTSVHWFMLMVPCGRVVGCKRKTWQESPWGQRERPCLPRSFWTLLASPPSLGPHSCAEPPATQSRGVGCLSLALTAPHPPDPPWKGAVTGLLFSEDNQLHVPSHYRRTAHECWGRAGAVCWGNRQQMPLEDSWGDGGSQEPGHRGCLIQKAVRKATGGSFEIARLFLKARRGQREAHLEDRHGAGRPEPRTWGCQRRASFRAAGAGLGQIIALPPFSQSKLRDTDIRERNPKIRY